MGRTQQSEAGGWALPGGSSRSFQPSTSVAGMAGDRGSGLSTHIFISERVTLHHLLPLTPGIERFHLSGSLLLCLILKSGEQRGAHAQGSRRGGCWAGPFAKRNCYVKRTTLHKRVNDTRLIPRVGGREGACSPHAETHRSVFWKDTQRAISCLASGEGGRM